MKYRVSIRYTPYNGKPVLNYRAEMKAWWWPWWVSVADSDTWHQSKSTAVETIERHNMHRKTTRHEAVSPGNQDDLW